MTKRANNVQPYFENYSCIPMCFFKIVAGRKIIPFNKSKKNERKKRGWIESSNINNNPSFQQPFKEMISTIQPKTV